MLEVVYVVVFLAPGHGLLDLYGNVSDAVVVVRDLQYAAAQRGEVLIAGFNDDVSREGLASRRYGPDVHIVNKGHALLVLYVATELVHVDVLRGPLQQNVHHREHQVPAAPQDQQRYEEAQDRVGNLPFKSHDEYRGDDHADGPHQVGQYVLEGALDVHAVPRGPVQDPCGGNVYQETAGADDKHGQSVDVRIFRAEGPMVRLEDYPSRDQP